MYSGRITKMNLFSFIKKHLIAFILFGSLFFHVLISPSPLSRYFWISKHVWPYHKTAYRITKRDEMIRKALELYIPRNPDVIVCTHNWLNCSHLAQRRFYYPFSYKADEAEFIILDTKRPGVVLDKKDRNLFRQEFERIKSKCSLVYKNDGFYIFGRES